MADDDIVTNQIS